MHICLCISEVYVGIFIVSGGSFLVCFLLVSEYPRNGLSGTVNAPSPRESAYALPPAGGSAVSPHSQPFSPGVPRSCATVIQNHTWQLCGHVSQGVCLSFPLPLALFGTRRASAGSFVVTRTKVWLTRPLEQPLRPACAVGRFRLASLPHQPGPGSVPSPVAPTLTQACASPAAHGTRGSASESPRNSWLFF